MRRLIPLAVLLAAAAVLLWQADLPPEPRPVTPQEVFTAKQIQRATDYRDTGLVLAAAQLAAVLAAAALIALRGPGPAARLRRPWLVAGAVTLWLSAVALPFDLVAHRRAVDVGLDLRSGWEWAGDRALQMLLLTLLVSAAYAAGLPVYRRFGPAGVGVAVGLLVAAVTLLQPILIDPLFLSTRPIASPQLRADVARLEDALDAHPRSVEITDAGTRTTTENAHVDGLGPTVRVIIDDTALQGAGPAEVRALVAHELAHVARHHTLKGVLWFWALGVPLLVGVLWWAARRGPLDRPGGAAAVVAGIVVVSIVTLPLQNLISRRIEAEADWVGLGATRDPAGMERQQARLALANLSHPDPPAWAVWLLYTHPPVMDRIAVARSYAVGSSGESSNSGRLLMPSRVRHLE